MCTWLRTAPESTSTTPVVSYHPSSSTTKGLFGPADPKLLRLSPITSDEQMHLTEELDTGSEANTTSPETSMAKPHGTTEGSPAVDHHDQETSPAPEDLGEVILQILAAVQMHQQNMDLSQDNA